MPKSYEEEELLRLLSGAQPGAALPGPVDYEFNNRAQGMYKQADELDQQSMAPMARPQGLKENAISGIRAFIEGVTRPSDPGAMSRRREDQHAAEMAALAERAGKLRTAGYNQQQLGETARLRKVQEDNAAREAADQEFQHEVANRPKPVNYSPGSAYGSEDPKTGKVTIQGTVPSTSASSGPKEVQTTLRASDNRSVTQFRNPDGSVFDVVSTDPVPKTASQVNAGISMEAEPAAVRMAALRYLQDGTMPAMSGAAGAEFKKQVLLEADRISHDAPVAANAADYKASTGALSTITKQRNQVVAFEKTARANLDMAVDAGRKLLDTGSPLLNMPLRTIQARGLGDADLAAYNAALRVATNEVARVVNSANTNGVLSDSARHEFEAALNPNATLGQILKVADILRQDMDNRKLSLEAQEKELRDGMRTVHDSYSNPNAPAQAPAPAAPAPAAGKRRIRIN